MKTSNSIISFIMRKFRAAMQILLIQDICFSLKEPHWDFLDILIQRQEDRLDLITALVKFNCLPTLIAQCRYESSG